MIKLQLDGDSRIGVSYAQEYQAVSRYEELMGTPTGKSFSLRIELVNEFLNLVLISDESGKKTIYKNVAYTPEIIKKLLIGIDLGKSFQFVHVFYKNNLPMIAKPFRLQQFIVLSNIEFLNPVNL